ncbi:hypothetical protein Mkiyose1665_59100 [Mycobacterium kiyosense]|uniref:Uncharacterized protein n=1 Tax=Mycobacterium kiyosense TaxID=2871094 RepID=A0AA37V7K1_9MYCO|nr:hypothetical protein MKCMC460_60660 [Mycobacterium sp. 20KCMC460]GLB85999.1 hypothetical protein SRL2020028_52550 [Mycobacterium kiyosense]GLB92887.1 hypothetical protein SRL2020130_57040 [Mycobacterium kiyosense]GLB98670.1 hypothetical protein SRL2020226_54460 [Mycobacterium kiyosense]GLC04993.1 hypothetical protein SRL2020400_55840 [Mycobacterium kiyosense]
MIGARSKQFCDPPHNHLDLIRYRGRGLAANAQDVVPDPASGRVVLVRLNQPWRPVGEFRTVVRISPTQDADPVYGRAAVALTP